MFNSQMFYPQHHNSANSHNLNGRFAHSRAVVQNENYMDNFGGAYPNSQMERPNQRVERVWVPNN